MGTVRRISYTEPVYGLDGQHADVHMGLSAHDDGDGTATAVVNAFTGQPSARVVATGPVDDAVNGRRTSFRTDRVGAWLTAKEVSGQTTLSVDDSSGFNDKDPVAIFNVSADGVPTTPEFLSVDGGPPSGTTLDVENVAGSGLVETYFKGARIVNLASEVYDVAVGIDGRPGVKSQLTAPSAVTIALSEVVAGDIRVTITAVDEDEATHYDTYVRTARFRRIEPGWVPDDADRTTTAAFDALTFGGGADCVPDGAGDVLGGGAPYYVGVVVKNGAGVRDVDESALSNVVAITLA